MKDYIKKNSIPLLIQVVFILMCICLPKEYAIYTNFMFYGSLLIYFIVKKEVSLKEWKKQLSSGNKFWMEVMWTSVFFIFAFMFTSFLEGMFPNVDTGTINLERDTWYKLILFAISTIFFPAVVEETFYRKSLISFKNKKWLILTSIFSMLMFGLEHALMPLGILNTVIWALPLTVAYIKTRNVFVPMTAHFIGNLIGNGTTVVFVILNWLG